MTFSLSKEKKESSANILEKLKLLPFPKPLLIPTELTDSLPAPLARF